MTTLATKPLSRYLYILQGVALALIILFSPNTKRWAIWLVEQPNVFEGFRGAFLFLFGIPLIALMILTGILAAYSADYRRQFGDTLNAILSIRYGGIWWLVIVVWMAIGGALWATDASLARFGAIHTMMLLVMALIVANMARQEQDKPMLLAFSVSAVFQSLIAIGQIVKQDALGLGALGELRWDSDNLFGFAETTFRGYGLTAHPNMLAGYLLVGLFASGALLIRHGLRSGWGIGAITMLVIIAIGLLVTLSRTALMAVVVASIVLAMRNIRIFRRMPSKTTWMILIPIIVVVLIIGAVFGSTFIERNRGLSDSEGVKNRIFFEFPNTTDVIKDQPIVGVGENNLMLEIGQNKFSFLDNSLLLPAHNAYVVLMAELGSVGLVLFLLALGTMLWQFTQHPDNEMYLWTVCVLAVSVVMLFDYYMWLDYRSRIILFWIIGMWWGYKLKTQATEA